MRKYIILPSEEYQKLIKKSLRGHEKDLSVPLDELPAKSLDEKLKAIMHMDESDDKKRILYSQLLQKKIDAERLDLNLSDSPDQAENSRDLKDLLTNILPKSFVKNAIGLLHFMLNSGTLKWDDNFEVSFFDSDYIKNTNILDLINYTIRNLNSKPKPQGVEYYKDWLRRVSIPGVLVGNLELLSELNNSQYTTFQNTTKIPAANTLRRSHRTKTQDTHKKIKTSKTHSKWLSY